MLEQGHPRLVNAISNDSEFTENQTDENELTQNNENIIQPDENEDEETTYDSIDPYANYESAEEETDSFESEPTQDNLINASEETEKLSFDQLQKKTKNEAAFFNRSNALLLIGGVFALFIIIFTVFVPMFKTKKQQTQKELPQAAKPWTNFDDWEEPEVENESSQAPEMQNSADTAQPQKEEEEIPEIIIDKNEEAPSVSQSHSSGISRPRTNSNEQQKQSSRIQLEDYSSKINPLKNGSIQNNQNVNNPYATFTGGNASAYTPTALNQNMARYMQMMTGSDSYSLQNDQKGKQDFFNSAKDTGGQMSWNNEYTLWKGTIIPAVLETGINTDLPGVVIATVTTNVYSSLDGSHLLIPQGSKLIAEYNSSVSYNQNRVQVAWNTLIRPDGLEVNLGGLNGVDPQGVAGYKGWVNQHPFEFLKAMGLIVCFSLIDTKANNLVANSTNTYAQNAISDAYSETKKLNNKIVERALDIQPTIKISNGTEIKLITNVSMDLHPVQQEVPVRQPYVRKK